MVAFFRRNHARQSTARQTEEADAQKPGVREFEQRRYPGTWRLSLTQVEPEHLSWLRIVSSTALTAIKDLVDSSSRLLVLAIVWYGLLTLSYDRFYGPLGIGAGDVGLSYTTILASSVGAAVAVIVYVLCALALLGFLFWLARKRRNENLVGAIKRRTPAFMLWVTLGIGILVAAVMLPIAANEQAKMAQAGCNVSSPRLPGLPVSVLSISASRVCALSTDPEVRYKNLEDVLYLGQANGTLVFYHDGVQPIYVPSQNIILEYLPDAC